MTPAEIRAHNFPSAGRGTYRSIDVDEFIGEIASAFESINQEKNEYIRRIAALTEKVEAYQKEENNISAALLTAQKMSASITAEAETAANEKLESATAVAEQTLSEAQLRADELLTDAQTKSDAMISEAEAVAKQTVESASVQAEKTLTDAESVASEQITKADVASRDKMLKADNYYNEKVAAADKKAAETVAAAEQRAAEINAQNALEQAEQQKLIDLLKLEANDFRSSLLVAYAEHIELIKKLPELAAEQVAALKAETPEAEIVEEATEEIAEETSEEVEYDDVAQAVYAAAEVEDEEELEEVEDEEEFDNFTIEGFDSGESANVCITGTVYEVVDDIDDDEGEEDSDAESFFRGFFKKK